MKEIDASKSSNIEKISYDGEHMKVYFRSGGVYQYEGVDGELFGRFADADSFGKFFLQEIKGKFPFKRLM